jgi:hypothetical protein
LSELWCIQRLAHAHKLVIRHGGNNKVAVHGGKHLIHGNTAIAAAAAAAASVDTRHMP